MAGQKVSNFSGVPQAAEQTPRGATMSWFCKPNRFVAPARKGSKNSIRRAFELNPAIKVASAFYVTQR